MMEDVPKLDFDTKIFPLLAIQKAVQEVSRSCAFSIVTGPNDSVVVQMSPVARGVDFAAVSTELTRRVLDLTIQSKITEETRTIRAALISAAMRGAGSRDEL